ncbi:MAG TPA: M14 family zinc carboxypeptidase [Gammaproteobacteria bacterium]|nr:carboxypeptidase regulatory-like domain-containing protein [Xanthomonadales bacterium]MCB1594187.1 carboxypeptidase regulatory-like domain-containing protein [Xanthomonadales bacterium]HOP22497.1 M14 family zinc carboxypeptidase [Gammaproteobacteria bacterium]HPI96167.1 M14 family zinc carboxypeptidase [Gammaproteobacteria bacterium]HPQ87621.1 M14 family zinc carboxypeptidase [Gammaproteobacteria bacterium]
MKHKPQITTMVKNMFGGISKKFLLIFLTLLINLSSQAGENKRWIVFVSYSQDSQIDLIANKFDHFRLNREKETIGLEVDSDEMKWLQDNYFSVEIDSAKSERLQQSLIINQNAQVDIHEGSGIPGFSCYRTVEETFATAESLVANYPGLASWGDFGDSWEKTQNAQSGYNLNVLKITNNANTFDKPALFVTSGIHAREYTNSELATRFAEWLLSSYGEDADATWLVDYNEVHLMLHANPDGRKKAETGLSWRKNTNNNHCPNTNSRGIDLNRNFNFEWGCCGGSSTSACEQTYRGPIATSEPESEAIQLYMDALYTDYREDDLASVAPDTTEGIYLDIHSYGELILSSWGFSTAIPPNGSGILSLARKFAYFNNYAPQLGSTGIVDGSTKDYAYGRFGVPGYTIELGTSFFEDCNYFEDSIVNQNIETLVYAAKAARRPYTISKGPDISEIQPITSPALIGQSFIINAQADDQRYVNGSGLAEPSQNILQAQYSIDAPPWHSGAVTHNMSASDSMFNSPQEQIQASVDTTGLSTGKHSVFIRAQDADGNWGAVSALFFDIIDPLTAPIIHGTITDINSGSPVAFADIKINSYQLQADANGEYLFQIPAGTYDIVVSKEGYLVAEELNINLVDSQSYQSDFSLTPLVEVYSDDGENGNAGWTVQGGWILSDELASSPTHAWNDSVSANYPNSADYSLTSPVIDLSQASDATLIFNHRYDFESSYDYGYLEISTDNGMSWTELDSFNGNANNQWTTVEYSLENIMLSTQTQIRFRIDTDTSVTRDGWYIDDIIIQKSYLISEDLIFDNGFE